MKVSDSDIIKTSEKDLIDAIAGELDWDAIEGLFREKHNLSLEDELEYKDGDIVIHDNQIAYKLNFDIKVKLSVLFDRKGECLGVSTSEKQENDEVSGEMDAGDNLQSEHPVPSHQVDDNTDIEMDESISEIASEVAVMIPDNNTDSDDVQFDQKTNEDDS